MLASSCEPRLPVGTKRPIRAYCSPAPGVNLYLQQFYAALAPYGVELAGACAVTNQWLRAHAGQLDVVHLNWPEDIWRCRGASPIDRLRGIAGLWTFLRLAKRLCIQIVWTVHNIEHHEGADRLDRIAYRMLARFANLRICHGEAAVAQTLATHGPGAVVNMPIGNYKGAYLAALSRGEARARLGVHEQRLLVCFGEVRRYKGFDRAVECLAKLDGDYVLVIAGRPHDQALTATLREAAARDARLRLRLELLPDADLANLLEAADCILLPYARVTGSGVLLTALTAGRGVVCSDLPFFREILAHEPLAGVIAGQSPAELARAIEQFFLVPIDQRQAAARALADRFDWSEVVRPVASWLQSCRG